MKVRRRFLHPLWLLVSLPGYLGWRLIPALATGPVGIAVGFLLLSSACVLVPLSVNTRSIANRQMADRVAWAGLLTMGFLSTLFCLTVLRDLGLMAARLFWTGNSLELQLSSARWTLVVAVVATLIGLGIARRPRLVEIDVPIADLPVALQGFSIAQITDLHVGPTIKRGFVQRVVERVNQLRSDMIVITGDLVDGSVPELGSHTAPLSALSARHGVYFVTGNHEYYSGELAWTAELRRLGLIVLKNQHVVLQHDGAAVLVAGVTDYSAHYFDPAQRSDPAASLTGAAPGTRPKILLAHQPSSAPAAAAAGFDLQLSGHTHGGQFWPWNLFVRYFQPFTHGLNRLQNLTVYVSRGTGYWGPPNRFIVPAEITRLRLVAG